MSQTVLERKVIPPGKPFIRKGEEHARAYIVQNGLIQSYIIDGDEKIIIDTYNPGDIVAEVCLMSDEPLTMDYEAVESTTVVMMTRADFQKKISQIDPNISMILEHIMKKINFKARRDIDKALYDAEIDDDAYKIVQSLIGKLPEEKKIKYKNALMPHMNGLMKDIKFLKKQS